MIKIIKFQESSKAISHREFSSEDLLLGYIMGHQIKTGVRRKVRLLIKQ